MSQEYEKLSSYAQRMGLKYQTVWKQYKEGRLPHVRKINGSLFVPLEKPKTENDVKRAITYSRVSISQNKDNCERQSQRLYEFSIAQGWEIKKQVKEYASGMNEDRPKLWSILNSDDWDVLVVEHKDRLTRFGFSFIEGLVKEKGKKVVVVNSSSESNNPEEELVEDLASIVTPFCARIYGKRRGKVKSDEMKNHLGED